MTRCPKCKYALINGVCPICDGRKVAERLPMLAPLPEKRGAKTKRGRLRLLRNGASR